MKKLMTLFLVSLALSTSLFAQDASKKGSEITLTTDNLVIMRSDFNPSSVSKVIEETHALDSKLPSGYPIYLFLYTPGGSITAGLEMFEALKGLNRPVHTITLFAASMGFQTVQQLGKRYILKYGTLMSHKARGGFQGEFGDGESQLDSRYGQWLRLIGILDADTVARTNKKQTLQSYRAAYAPELWLNGEEAVKQGYADEVVTLKCDSELNKKETSQIFNLGFFSVEAFFAGCPLRTQPTKMSLVMETTEGSMSVDKFVQKGGKFGSCNVAPTTNSWGEEIASTPKLCAIDPSLTLEIMQKAKVDKQMSLSKELKNNVQYSY